jgi:predicted enzyme related to lactoylglutathione lyase
MPRVVHFEIFSTAPERAIQFYTELFGWAFTETSGHPGYWHIRTGSDDESGINGGLTRPYIDTPAGGIGSWVCTVEVDSIERYTERIERGGGEIVVPRFAIENVGFMLHARDPDSNLFGVIEKTSNGD